ncbi:MAG: hypothetical protein MHPSP_000633 [Paramarteilia canceri]
MSGNSPGRRLTVLYGAVRGFDLEQVLSLHMHGLVQNASPQTWQDQPQFLSVQNRLHRSANELRPKSGDRRLCERATIAAHYFGPATTDVAQSTRNNCPSSPLDTSLDRNADRIRARLVEVRRRRQHSCTRNTASVLALLDGHHRSNQANCYSHRETVCGTSVLTRRFENCDLLCVHKYVGITATPQSKKNFDRFFESEIEAKVARNDSLQLGSFVRESLVRLVEGNDLSGPVPAIRSRSGSVQSRQTAHHRRLETPRARTITSSTLAQRSRTLRTSFRIETRRFDSISKSITRSQVFYGR